MPVTHATPLRPDAPPRRSESMRGIAYMALGMFLFSAVDAGAKFLTETLHPIQIVWVRQLGLLAGVVVLLAVKGLPVLRTEHRGMQMARGALAACSATLFIIGVKFVPLADAVAVAFVAPFLVTLMGALILREPVGIRRWSAVTIGFIGTLIVIRPGMGVIHPAVLLVLGAAFLFAVRQIISRMLAGADPVSTTVAYTALTGSLLLTIPLPFVWQWPGTGLEWGVMVLIAVLAGCAEFLVIKALEVAQAVVVAPLQYTLLIWSTGYGYFIFHDLPDLWTLVGASIIVATGLYTLNRERKLQQGRA